MKFSVTGQENVTFKYKWLLNIGDHIDRFDNIFKLVVKKERIRHISSIKDSHLS